MITEAQHDKLRYLEEVHSAQRKVNDLQTHLKVLDSKVAEKEAEIRILQEKKSKFLKRVDQREFIRLTMFPTQLQSVDHRLIRTTVLV